jgi:ATP-dependent protease ClpP protease subunit
MLSIRNQADTFEVDIFGTIGSDWFDEGITMQSLRATLKEAGSKPVTLNIASLGGIVDHALVIHDMLSMHPAPTTARILGATASAATVVAMGCDKVEMSENALFLVHNARMMTAGTAEDLRKDADDLDQFDDRIVNVYVEATGMSKRRVRELMKEERWIDASEAQQMGFVDRVFTPAKAAAIAIPVNEINDSGLFPLIKTEADMDQNSFFATLRDDFLALFASVKPREPEAEVVLPVEPEPEVVVEPEPAPEPEPEPQPDVTAEMTQRITALEAELAERDLEIERLKAQPSPEAHEDKPIGAPKPLTEAEKWVNQLSNVVTTKHF